MADEIEDAPIPTEPTGAGSGGNPNGVIVSTTPTSGEYATISEAIAASTNGVIFVKPGTYTETLVTFTTAHAWSIYATAAEIHAEIVIEDNVNIIFVGGTYIGGYSPDWTAPYMITTGSGAVVTCNLLTLSVDETTAVMRLNNSTLVANNCVISIFDTGIETVGSIITCNLCNFYGNTVYGAAGIRITTNSQTVNIFKCYFDGDAQIVDNIDSIGTDLNIDSSTMGNISTYSHIVARTSTFNTLYIVSNQAAIEMYSCDMSNGFISSNVLVGSKFVSCNIGSIVSLDSIIDSQFIGCHMSNVYMAGSGIQLIGCHVFGSTFHLSTNIGSINILSGTTFNCPLLISSSRLIHMYNCYMHLAVTIQNTISTYMTGCSTYSGLVIDLSTVTIDNSTLVGTSSAALTSMNGSTIAVYNSRLYAKFQNDASVVYIISSTGIDIRIDSCHIEGENPANTGILITNSGMSGSIRLYSNVFKSVTNSVLNLISNPGRIICYHADNMTTSATGYTSSGGDQDNTINTF